MAKSVVFQSKYDTGNPTATAGNWQAKGFLIPSSYLNVSAPSAPPLWMREGRHAGSPLLGCCACCLRCHVSPCLPDTRRLTPLALQ